MCLAIPGKVVKIEKLKAWVKYPGEERQILVGEKGVKVGDMVLVQMGVIIKILSKDEAKQLQKGSAQLLLILLAMIIFVSGGVYLYQNSKADNPLPIVKYATQKATQSNSNNYLNQSLNLGFTYQKDLTVKEDSEEEFNRRGNGNFRKNFTGYVGYEPPIFLGSVVVLGKDNNYDNNPFSLWVFDNPNNLTADGWFDKYWYYPFVWGVFDWTSKGHIAMDQQASVSGELAKSKIVSYQLGKPKYIYATQYGKMYLFRIISDSQNTGEQILSSFKFIK